MKIKKKFRFSDKNQIWRLLISETDKIVIETRNTELKEVFFHCYNLTNGKRVFKDFQLAEKFWVGIEKIYNDIIYFHGFAKPNMPEHKKIFAYNLNQMSLLWENDLTFITLFENKIYASEKKFNIQKIFTLNPENGIKEESDENLNSILEMAEHTDNYDDYFYPEKYSKGENLELDEFLQEEFKANSDTLEYIIYGNLLFFNYYELSNNLLDNIFVVYDIDKRKKVQSDILNRGLSFVSADSFFIYKNFLIILKNKNEVLVYSII